MYASAPANTYLFPEPQLLLLLLLSRLILCKFAPRKLALVETGKIFFARGRVEVDFLLVDSLYFALFAWGRCVPHSGCGSDVYVSGGRVCCCGRCAAWLLEIIPTVAGVWRLAGANGCLYSPGLSRTSILQLPTGLDLGCILQNRQIYCSANVLGVYLHPVRCDLADTFLSRTIDTILPYRSYRFFPPWQRFQVLLRSICDSQRRIDIL